MNILNMSLLLYNLNNNQPIENNIIHCNIMYISYTYKLYNRILY
jgi:hypothetical protein